MQGNGAESAGTKRGDGNPDCDAEEAFHFAGFAGVPDWATALLLELSLFRNVTCGIVCESTDSVNRLERSAASVWLAGLAIVFALQPFADRMRPSDDTRAKGALNASRQNIYGRFNARRDGDIGSRGPERCGAKNRSAAPEDPSGITASDERRPR